MVSKGRQRLAEAVAAKIERDVVARGWPVGEALGTEAELMASHQVSRAVLREAARIVEHHGVAEMRRGNGGGLIVIEPSSGAVQTAARLHFTYVGVSRQQIFDARVAIELAGIQQVVSCLTDEGRQMLQDVVHEERTAGTAAEHHRFHATLASQSGNPVLEFFVEVLASLDRDLVKEQIEHASRAELSPQKSVRAHEAILEAVLAGDGALATERMHRHLTAIRDLMRDPPLAAGGG